MEGSSGSEAGEGEAPAPDDGAAEPPAEPEPEPAAFNPCPTDGTPCRIMPLGDSITFGTASADGAGYRLELFRHAVADEHAVTLVGRVQAGPTTNVEGQAFPRNNEGYPGIQIQPLAGMVDAAVAAADPDIILLHIGTNNLYQGMGPAVPGQLEDMLDQIVEAAPDALVVVAQITPLGGQFGANGVDQYNATMPAMVQERVDAGQHLLLVNMNAAFRAANANVAGLLADGIHPNATGYGIMADTWYTAIESVLP
jgi:lysophospholipase L1-like esterase